MRTMLDVVRDRLAGVDIPLNADIVTLNIPLKIFLDGRYMIIDIETTGLSPDSSEIVTLGVIHNDNMRIIQNIRMPPDDFKKLCVAHIIERYPGVIYAFAFNHDFEKRFLGNGYGFNWRELQPYIVKKDVAIKYCHYHFGEGKQVPGWWEEAKSAEKVDDFKAALFNIIIHNSQCLMKEYALFLVSESNYCGCE